jgi:hypothetical protein
MQPRKWQILIWPMKLCATAIGAKSTILKIKLLYQMMGLNIRIMKLNKKQSQTPNHLTILFVPPVDSNPGKATGSVRIVVRLLIVAGACNAILSTTLEYLSA